MAEGQHLALPGGYGLCVFFVRSGLKSLQTGLFCRELLPKEQIYGSGSSAIRQAFRKELIKNEAPGSPELLHRGGYMINEFNDNICFFKDICKQPWAETQLTSGG